MPFEGGAATLPAFMDSDITHLAGIYKLWAWIEKKKTQLTWAAVAAVVVGLGVYFYLWRKETSERTAAEQLSSLRPTQTPNGPPIPVKAADYLKVASDHPGTDAAGQAALLAGGAFYADNKYAEAKAQFDRFLREYPQSPLRGGALYGSAACLEAQGKTSEAAAAYKDIVDHHSSEPVVPRAKLALARSYEAQKQTEAAFNLYEDLATTERFSSIGVMADARLEELKRANPALAARSATNTPAVTTTVKQPAIVLPSSTNTGAAKTNKP